MRECENARLRDFDNKNSETRECENVRMREARIWDARIRQCQNAESDNMRIQKKRYFENATLIRNASSIQHEYNSWRSFCFRKRAIVSAPAEEL